MSSPEACARCGAHEDLERHHVVPRSRGGGEETVVLCHRCHVALHHECGDYAAWGSGGARKVLQDRGAAGRAFLQEIGRRGGLATARKDGHLRRIAPLGGRAVVARYGTTYMRELGRRGALARWQKSKGGSL